MMRNDIAGLLYQYAASREEGREYPPTGPFADRIIELFRERMTQPDVMHAMADDMFGVDLQTMRPDNKEHWYILLGSAMIAAVNEALEG